jgi:hypothetical protein
MMIVQMRLEMSDIRKSFQSYRPEIIVNYLFLCYVMYIL